jgi:FkbM family methyltransferase
MEANDCYKFSTIRNFLLGTGQPPVERIVDVGVNVGSISLMMHDYFPTARIVGFEAVQEYWKIACERTAHVTQIELFHRAVTYEHLYADDLATYPRSAFVPLRILKGLPCAGPGWLGGSAAIPADHEMANRPGGVPGYQLTEGSVDPITLEEIMKLAQFSEIDLLKIDCEGCEHSVLGCALSTTLQKIRFIAGEYHGLQRFYEVMRHKLFATHKVNLIGDSTMGAFFAERLEHEMDGILRFNKDGMLVERPWLCEHPIDWHLFNEEFVLPEESASHALAETETHTGGVTSLESAIPFTDFVHKVITQAEPMSQNTRSGDLGFGWIYYGLIRNLRPDYVVAIGSCRGFMPFCAARAMQDNGRGRVIFVDPSYSGNGYPGWSGRGLWSVPTEVDVQIKCYGLSGWVTHLKLRSNEAFSRIRKMTSGASVGLVIIDGDHTHAQSMEDFELYSSLIEDGFVLFHDSISEECGVQQTTEKLRARGHPMITIHREVGLTIVEIPPAESTQRRWSYLCAPSNRAELLLPYARRPLRPGDRVLDAYCGSAPLACGLCDMKIFGFDSDPHMINLLREQHPQHVWERIDELRLPFSSLPEDIDLLLALGLSEGHARWDPQHVLDNVRYLLGRYLPRACLFESPAEYHNADILDQLCSALTRLGYSCEQEQIETNLASFATRKVLLAQWSSS